MRGCPRRSASSSAAFPPKTWTPLAVISAHLPIALGLIAAITFLVLLIMFESVLIPLKALVLNVLSLSAMFGAMVWIFQDGHLSSLLGFTSTGNLIATMPVLMFCVAFGLSMDYEVFLISRIKEQHDAGWRRRGRRRERAAAHRPDHHGRRVDDERRLSVACFQRDQLHQDVRDRTDPRRPRWTPLWSAARSFRPSCDSPGPPTGGFRGPSGGSGGAAPTRRSGNTRVLVLRRRSSSKRGPQHPLLTGRTDRNELTETN